MIVCQKKLLQKICNQINPKSIKHPDQCVRRMDVTLSQRMNFVIDTPKSQKFNDFKTTYKSNKDVNDKRQNNSY